jgi:hypothetical protein
MTKWMTTSPSKEQDMTIELANQPTESLTVNVEPTPKRRGRPAGSANKTVAKKTKKVKPVEQEQRTEADWQSLLSYLKFLQEQNEAQAAALDSYAHKEIQTKAVISYLETKLELK